MLNKACLWCRHGNKLGQHSDIPGCSSYFVCEKGCNPYDENDRDCFEAMLIKIRPNATLKHSWGIDGRDSHYYISYNCPKCDKHIKEGDIACTDCGTLFDWSVKPHIDYTPKLVWN